MTPRAERKTARASLIQQLPLLVGLVLLWMLLWGAFTWLNLVTGIVIALVVTRVFYLPPVELSNRFNLFWAVLLFFRFLGELVIASFQVAFQALLPRPLPRAALVAVPLRSNSDFIMTLTAIMMSLIPGSLVVEADRERSTLYMHALVRDTAGVEKIRAQVLATEWRIVRALGSRDDLSKGAP